MTAKGEKAEDKLREITECSICMSAFTDPRMLPCIHTFCFECLKHTAEATQKKPGDKMPCPLCRKEFIIPADGMNGVQKNFFIENLLEFKTILQMGSGTIVCDICNIRNEGKTGHIPKARMRCLECKEHYCNSCVKVHQFQKATKDHQMIKIGSDMKSERNRITSTKTCTKHIQKLLDYYCADCKKIVCVSCFIERHASHKCSDVTSVEAEFRQKIERKSSKILTPMNEIVFIRNNNEKRKLDFLTEIAKREKEIHKRNNELKEMIEQHTTLLLDELSVIKSMHIKEMETEMEEIERYCSILASFESYCTELTLKGSAIDICSSVDELLARADDLERDHETFVCRPHQSLEVSFQATDLGNVLQNANSNFVGHVEGNILTFLQDIGVKHLGVVMTRPPRVWSGGHEVLIKYYKPL